MDIKEQKLDENIHAVLVHSHMAYFVLFLLGLLLHLVFPIKISNNSFIVFFWFDSSIFCYSSHLLGPKDI